MKLLILGLCLLTGAAQAQVYRCGNTYSEEPCKGGREVDVSPTVSDHRGPKNKEIYLCKSNQGSLYWSARTCASQGWMVERIALVPRGVSWNEQVSIARGQRDRAHENADEQTRNYGPPAAVESNHAECQAHEERVKWLDETCRSTACSLPRLEWVREERRKARDQQFRLRCR